MKLLLTSAGITNQAIANALFELCDKAGSQLKVAYIPTASNVEPGDKGWVIDNLDELRKCGIAYIDIVDISALSKEQWRPRLEEVDVLLFSGGNTLHLMHHIVASGLIDLLPKLLEDKVYMGISAGSMVTEKTFNKDVFSELYFEVTNYLEKEGLGFIDFYFLPHLNSPTFPEVNAKVLERLTKNDATPAYAMDDQTAIKIDGGDFEIVGSGEHWTNTHS